MFLVVFCAVLAAVFSQKLSQNGLENENEIRPLFRSCESLSQKNDNQNLSLKEKGCFCDKGCANYGDCCFDSPYFEITGQKRASTAFDCMQTAEYDGIYLRNTCPYNWMDTGIRKKCEEKYKMSTNPLLLLPTIGQKSRTAYRNVYCGICNREDNFIFLETQMECQRYSDKGHKPIKLYKEETRHKTPEGDFEAILDYWFNDCTIVGVNLSHKFSNFRSCIPNLVKTCPKGFTDVITREKCLTYTSIVRRGTTLFRNSFCADCNEKHLKQPLVHGSGKKRKFRSICNEAKNETSLSNKWKKETNSSYLKIQPHKNSRGKTFNSGSKPQACISISRHITIKNGTSQIYKCFQENTTCGVYPILPHSSAAKYFFFSPEQPLLKRREWCEFYEKVFFSIIEMTTAVLLLSLHLTAFTLSYKESTTFDKTVASLSLAELILYSITIFREADAFRGFQIYNEIKNDPNTCLFLSLLNQYCVLAIYCWMVMIPFQIWHSFFKLLPNRSSWQFPVFCVYGWGVPGVVTLILFLIHLNPGGMLPADLLPRLGEDNCVGIHKDATLSLFFFIYFPATIVLILSLIFLGLTVYTLHKKRYDSDSPEYAVANRAPMDFWFWCKLISFMGLGLDLYFISVLKRVLIEFPVGDWNIVINVKLVFLGGHFVFFYLTLY